MTLYDYFNAFSRYIEEDNPTDKMIVLYWVLLDTFNRRGWPRWAGVDNQRLMLMCRTADRKVMARARDALCKAGFLEYKPGKKGRATEYGLLIPEKYGGGKGGEIPPESTPETGKGGEIPPESAPESTPENAPENVPPNKTKTKNLSSSSTTTAPSPGMANAELTRVMAAYGEFCPGASGLSREKLAEYCRALGAELCLRAMDVAKDAGQRTWQYLNGILYNWTQAGIRSLADLERREEERRRNRGGADASRAPGIPHYARGTRMNPDGTWDYDPGDTSGSL